MIVPICVDGAANEWCVLEFQGDMIPHADGDMKDVDIGSLRYENGVPTVRIGNHIVAGKVAKLPKPFAILEKDVGEDETPGSDATEGEEKAVRQYQVVGIARTRVLFSTRPKPILS